MDLINNKKKAKLNRKNTMKASDRPVDCMNKRMLN